MKKGITFLETLLVIGIMAILIAIIGPSSLDFYKSQQLDANTQEIIQTLRRAQLKAMSNESDSSFGVYSTNNSYILFKGSSYASRQAQYDEIFSLPATITVSDAPKQVVFSKFEGTSLMAVNIVLKSDGETRTININNMGRINLE